MSQRQASGDKLLMKGLGERLRLLRKAYADKYGAEHHTKKRWAERLWVSPAMYGRWETGANLPKFVDLLRISLLFRVDPNFLVAGVLSEHLAEWLYRALKTANPELLDVADYWQRQSELFGQANRALADAAHTRKSSSTSRDASFVRRTSEGSPQPPKLPTRKRRR